MKSSLLAIIGLFLGLNPIQIQDRQVPEQRVSGSEIVDKVDHHEKDKSVMDQLERAGVLTEKYSVAGTWTPGAR